MLTSMVSERPGKPFPKVRGRVRIVEYVSNAQHGIYRVTACDVEDPRNHIHARP
jgi:hypothetical protein